ncbi:MAG: hypothetical protein L7G96_07535 [Vulcanisaeta sp.]|nr:hypothetical protein [Vulcanisaeta sp.]
MDLVLFAMCLTVIGALSSLIALLMRLCGQAKECELPNTENNVLPLVVALVLAIVAFIIMALLPPPPPCTNTACNYLMSTM